MMRRFHRLSCALPAALCAVLMTACAGPERAPHQPIKGVDTEKNEVQNPHDPPSGRGEGGMAAAPTPQERTAEAPPTSPGGPPGGARTENEEFLTRFADELAKEWKARPGIIAVFPALSRTPETRARTVTALGDLLMERTATLLEDRGVTSIVSGSSLVNDIRASNRGLDAISDLDDVYWLADRIGAAYVVLGTTDLRQFNTLERDRSVEVRWRAMRTADRGTIAKWTPRLVVGSFAELMYKYQTSPSDWRIGAAAEPFAPSLQLESRILGQMLARKIIADRAAVLAGKRVRVEPTVVTGRSGAHASVHGWSTEFERKLAEAAKAAGEASDPEAVAMRSGPVTIQGAEFATLGDAVDAFRTLRDRTRTGAVGDLETDFAAGLAEQLRAAGDLKLLSGDGEHEQMLAIIRREARGARAGTVDPATVAMMRAGGTEVLVTSTLRKQLEVYELRVTAHDLTTRQKVSHSLPFDARFNTALDAALAR